MDKKPEKLVPEVRFKGFTDDWEQHKLGDFGNVQMNKRIFKSQTLDSGDVPFYKIGTFGKKADAYISSELYEEYRNKYPYPKDGDLLISASGSIGKIVEYKGQRAYYQDSNIVWLDHDNRILNLFLKAFFQIVKWSGTEGSTIKRLYNKNILNTEIILPKIKEQTAIGKLIKKFDYLITLQQRKLEQLKQLKKALLQQLFADKNSKLPILRFKNFNSDWKQRKLEEIGKATGGTSIESEFSPYGSYKVINIGSYSEDHSYNDQGIRAINSDKTQKRILNKHDLTMILNDKTSTGKIIGSVLIIPSDNKYVYNQRTERIEPNTNHFSSLFLYHYLNAPIIRKKIISNAQGNTQIYVNWSSISKINYYMPNLSEQNKIGDFLDKISKNITLQKNKLTQLTTLKKYLLQKLFI